jgi:hypothetical protein
MTTAVLSTTTLGTSNLFPQFPRKRFSIEDDLNDAMEKHDGHFRDGSEKNIPVGGNDLE